MPFFSSVIRLLALSGLMAACLTARSGHATEVPYELRDVGIEEHLGAQVSVGDLKFKDESGQEVSLSSFFHRDRPVILALAYYECPNLCTMLLNGLTESLRNLDWTAGERFDIVTVSINPKETPELAAEKKAAYLESYGRKQSAAGWHFLTGEESQIHKLASQVGFGYRYDEREKQYAHASAIYVLTPEGRISRYLHGIEFHPKDLRLALLEASNGKIGTVVDRFVLFCYHYDPKTRSYSMALTRVMQAGSAGTVVLFGGFLAVFWQRERKRKAA